MHRRRIAGTGWNQCPEGLAGAGVERVQDSVLASFEDGVMCRPANLYISGDDTPGAVVIPEVVGGSLRSPNDAASRWVHCPNRVRPQVRPGAGCRVKVGCRLSRRYVGQAGGVVILPRTAPSNSSPCGRVRAIEPEVTPVSVEHIVELGCGERLQVYRVDTVRLHPRVVHASHRVDVPVGIATILWWDHELGP